MHSLFNRLNIWLTFCTSALFLLGALISSTSYFFLPSTPSVLPSLSLSDIYVTKSLPQLHYKYQSYYLIPSHYGQLRFNLSLDLRPAFHWNTKQIYAFLTLQYQTSKFEKNEIVFWDTIITEKDDAYLELDLTENKYGIYDVLFRKTNKLIGQLGNITLSWSIVPNVGYIHAIQAGAQIPIQFLEPPSVESK